MNGAEEAGSLINNLIAAHKWDLIVYSLDWHPKDHISFIENHAEDPAAKKLQPYKLKDGRIQVLWPTHCVQNDRGSELIPALALKVPPKSQYVKKGMNSNIDSYSAFMDNDKKTRTTLDDVLKLENINTCYFTGVAFDFCVGYSACDAVDLGYQAYVIEDATRPVAADTAANMKVNFVKKGVRLIRSPDVNLSGSPSSPKS